MHKTTGIKVIGLSNPKYEPNWVVSVEARLDTGATRSSIDEGFLSLLRLEEMVNEDAIKVRSANGTQRRDTVVLVVIDDDDELELEVSITNREHMAFPVILGRDYLGGLRMNIADAARFIADGMTMKIELSESVDKKIDDIREEVKAITKDAVDKIDRRWYITQVLLGLGLLGNAIAMLL